MGLVLIQHASLANYLPALYWFPMCGRLGVSIFFVLSGFLITRILLSEESLGNFYLRRALRIFPAFYAYLLCLKIVPLVGFAPTDNASWWAAACYVLNWAPFHHDDNIKHTWSLAFEEQFYLVWPLLFWCFRKRAAWMAATVVACWPLLRILKRGSAVTFTAGLTLQSTGYETLATGCLLALNWERISKLKFPPAFLTCLLLWGMFALEPYWPRESALWLPLLRDLLIAILLATTLAAPNGRWVRCLEAKPLVAMGTLSYSLYLWHPLFVKAQTDIVPRGWPCAIAVLAAALLSYFGLERPLLRWRRRLGSSAPAKNLGNEEPSSQTPLASNPFEAASQAT